MSTFINALASAFDSSASSTSTESSASNSPAANVTQVATKAMGATEIGNLKLIHRLLREQQRYTTGNEKLIAAGLTTTAKILKALEGFVGPNKDAPVAEIDTFVATLESLKDVSTPIQVVIREFDEQKRKEFTDRIKRLQDTNDTLIVKALGLEKYMSEVLATMKSKCLDENKTSDGKRLKEIDNAIVSLDTLSSLALDLNGEKSITFSAKQIENSLKGLTDILNEECSAWKKQDYLHKTAEMVEYKENMEEYLQSIRPVIDSLSEPISEKSHSDIIRERLLNDSELINSLFHRVLVPQKDQEARIKKDVIDPANKAAAENLSQLKATYDKYNELLVKFDCLKYQLDWKYYKDNYEVSVLTDVTAINTSISKLHDATKVAKSNLERNTGLVLSETKSKVLSFITEYKELRLSARALETKLGTQKDEFANEITKYDPKRPIATVQFTRHFYDSENKKRISDHHANVIQKIHDAVMVAKTDLESKWDLFKDQINEFRGVAEPFASGVLNKDGAEPSSYARAFKAIVGANTVRFPSPWINLPEEIKKETPKSTDNSNNA